MDDRICSVPATTFAPPPNVLAALLRASVALPALVKPPEPLIAPLSVTVPLSAWIVLEVDPVKAMALVKVPPPLKSRVALAIVAEPLAPRLPGPAALSVPAVIVVLPLYVLLVLLK